MLPVKPEISDSKPLISQESAIVLTLLLADILELKLGIEEVSEVFFRLTQEKGYKFPYLAMKRVGGGKVFSEDIANWMERLKSLGYTRNPLGGQEELTEEGAIACRRVLENERALNEEQQNLLPLASAIIELLQKCQPR